jgi:superfamily II DNA/RNA helicase
MVIFAPTGSGKTVFFKISILRLLQNSPLLPLTKTRLLGTERMSEELNWYKMLHTDLSTPLLAQCNAKVEFEMMVCSVVKCEPPMDLAKFI